jgi:hypothetical protein
VKAKAKAPAKKEEEFVEEPIEDEYVNDFDFD